MKNLKYKGVNTVVKALERITYETEVTVLLLYVIDDSMTSQTDDDTCSSVYDSRINSRLKAQVRQVYSTGALYI